MMDFERRCIITELCKGETKLLLQRNEHLVIKSSVIAQKYIKLGDQVLLDPGNAKIIKAHYLYNRSITYAEDDSETMTHAYEGRSRLLFLEEV